VSALLAEIDALLSDVNTLAQSAPPELQPGLEQVRNGLVKEAIDFSEAAHRAAPSDAIPAAAPEAPRGRAAQTRIVAMDTKAEQDLERAEARRSSRVFVAMAISIALAGAFHGWRFWGRRARLDAAPTFPGAPANSVVLEVPGGPVTIRSRDGRPFSEAEKQALREREALKGNRVEESGLGLLVIVPGGAPSGARTEESAP
jgi:hypothetical protein